MHYRRDIDGLRAIAVLAVMFFHLQLGAPAGGYIGVDIFFVISGYLIGGIVVDETSRGAFTYTAFYMRRVKRLFPAYFALALATLPFAWWLLLPTDFWAHAKSIVAATIFLPNVLFYRELGYFDAGAITKPMLHTWSLGVEEQFYIFFPLLMRLAVRVGRAHLATILVATALASLGLAQWLMTPDPAAAFYWLPARAWELTLGALASVPGVQRLNAPTRMLPWLNAAAVAAVLVPMFAYSNTTDFPGLSAVPPCLGTAWLLWVGARAGGGWIQRALASPPMVGIGRISYSLYLWHWPVIVFLMYYTSGETSWFVRVAALALIFVLAYLSWRFVEQPARTTKRPPRVVFGAAATSSALLVSLGLLIWHAKGFPSRLNDEMRPIADAAGDFLQVGGRCWSEDNDVIPGVAYCKLGRQDATPHALLWGDSHGRALRDGVDRVATESGVSVLFVFQGGCLPAFDYVKRESAGGPRADRSCEEQDARMRQWLAHADGIRSVLLVGRWSYYTEGHGIGIDRQNTISVAERAASADGGMPQGDVIEKLMLANMRSLHAQGRRVYVLEQLPEIPEFSSRKLFQRLRSGQDNLSSALGSFVSVPCAQVDARQARAHAILQHAADEGIATIIPTHDLFCSGPTCSAWNGTKPGYFDNNHVTVATSMRLRERLAPAFAP